LRILYRAGLVTDRRKGLWVYYALRPLRDGLAKDHLHKLRSHLAHRPDAARLLKKLSAWRRRMGGETRCVGKVVSKQAQIINVAAPPSALPGGLR
jgi:hypothetical protein